MDQDYLGVAKCQLCAIGAGRLGLLSIFLLLIRAKFWFKIIFQFNFFSDFVWQFGRILKKLLDI